MRENATITFVKAVLPIMHGNGRIKGYGFAIVQPGGTPIEFAYSTREEANKARRDLMKADHTYPMHPEMFDIVSKALQEAHTLGKAAGADEVIG